VAILRRHLLDKVAVSDLCEELGLQPTVFYRWQKELLHCNIENIRSSRAGIRDLRGSFLIEVIGRLLGMGSCRKDRTVVILQNFGSVASFKSRQVCCRASVVRS